MIETAGGLGLPTNVMRNLSLLTSGWTAKVFPGHFEFYRFIPFSAQSCGMLIAQRAGGASEITLQRWRPCYAQRARRFNARCPELWLIAPGCCCNTSSALVKRFEAQGARSLLQYTDVLLSGSRRQGPFLFFIFFLSVFPTNTSMKYTALLNLQTNLFLKKTSLDYVLREGDPLRRDASPDLALRDTLGVDGFLSTVDDKWKVIVS